MKIIKKEDQKFKPPIILVYGNEGIGKTTFASEFKNPIFIRTENGFPVGVTCDAFDVCSTGDEVVECFKQLIKEDHDYKTAVLDCLDGVENLVHQNLMKKSNVEDMTSASGGYGKAYEQSDNFMKSKLLPVIKYLRDAKNMWVVIIDHATCLQKEDPNGKYFRFEPACLHRSKREDEMSWINKYREDCDIVAFATGITDNVAVGYGANKRVLICEEQRRNVGKNRHRWNGADAVIDMSFDALYNKILNAVKVSKNEKNQGENQ